MQCNGFAEAQDSMFLLRASLLSLNDLWVDRACLEQAGHSHAATAWLKPSLESDKGTDQVRQGTLRLCSVC